MPLAAAINPNTGLTVPLYLRRREKLAGDGRYVQFSARARPNVSRMIRTSRCMNGVERALFRIDVPKSSGVEIGPLTRPLVRRGEGDISYIDRATTADLRRAYANQSVDINAIVDVDFVWGEKTLCECVDGRRFDYCIAAHVVEHVPDLIGWLNEVSSILKPGGVLSLIVPDKRFTFDILRRESGLRRVLWAHRERLRKPALRQIYDHFSHYVEVDGGAVWAGTQTLTDYTPAETKWAAFQRWSRNRSRYVDVHCWVFTPSSFVGLIAQLRQLGLIDLALLDLFTTEPGTAEFHAVLVKRKVDDWHTVTTKLSNPPIDLAA